MAGTRKTKAAAPKAAQDAAELHDPYQDLQGPEAVQEAQEVQEMCRDIREHAMPPEGALASPGEIIGPEDESELLGCQDGEEPDPPVEYAVAADPGLNLREEPSKAAPIIAELPRGVGVRPTGVTQGAWCEVVTGRLTGWVMGEFLEPLWDD